VEPFVSSTIDRSRTYPGADYSQDFKRTLASFSLEDKVGLVTGGARGLGLVMSQALVVSGSDVAIVDLNSESTIPSDPVEVDC